MYMWRIAGWTRLTIGPVKINPENLQIYMVIEASVYKYKAAAIHIWDSNGKRLDDNAELLMTVLLRCRILKTSSRAAP